MAESRDLISLNGFETEPFFLFFADFYQSSKRRNHHHRLPRAKWFNQQSSALSTSFPSRPRRSLRFPNLFEPCFRCVSAARNTSGANPFPSKPVFVSTCARARCIYIYIYVDVDRRSVERTRTIDGTTKEDHPLALVLARSNGGEEKARDRRGTHDTCTLCRGQPQTRPRILIVTRISDGRNVDTIRPLLAAGERTIQGKGGGGRGVVSAISTLALLSGTINFEILRFLLPPRYGNENV